MDLNSPGPHPCEDGRCDQVEQGNHRLCRWRTSDFEWCGDGLCDALESHEGSCSEDCVGPENREELNSN